MENEQTRINRYARQTSECNKAWFFAREINRIMGICAGVKKSKKCPLRGKCDRYDIPENPTNKGWIKEEFLLKKVPVIDDNGKRVMIGGTPVIIDKYIKVKEPVLDDNGKPVYKDKKQVSIDKVITLQMEAVDRDGNKILEGGTPLLKDEYQCENFVLLKR